MSALHLKYRPNTLDDMVGNRTLIQSLKSILERPMEEMPHTFLFQGQTGSGKTTFARIMSIALNCHSLDLHEINTRGIDNAKEIEKSMKFKPSKGPVKCYILDEVQRGTKDFFDAMLKPLEDTPKHVFFFLCTTDPQKVPTTIKNRCTQFTVESLSAIKLVKLMKKVCNSEGLDISLAALNEISNIQGISPRQVLVLLDQIKDIDNTENMINFIKRASIEEKQIIDLCRVLLNVHSKWDSVRIILNGISKEVRTDDIRFAVMGYMNKVLMGDKTDEGTAYRASCIIDWFAKLPFSCERALLNSICFQIKEE